MAYDFGLRLQQCRERKKLTQSAVAQKMHMSRATISGYENNTITPSVEALKSLALLYGVSIDFLLNLHPSPQVEEKEDRRMEQKELLEKIQNHLKEMQQEITLLKESMR